MPEEDDVACRNLLNPSPGQLGYRLEALLARGEVPGVDVHFFKVREEELTGSDIVAMRAKDHIWQLELSGYLEEIF